MKKEELVVPIEKDNICIERKNEKCIYCGYCKKVCQNDITVDKMYDITKSKKAICINCGQCANMCPTEAIKEKIDYIKIKKYIKDKNKKIVVSIAPAVRVALGEEFEMEIGSNVEGKIITALRNIGVDYVLDISFGADLTIIEEAKELVERINSNEKLPLFTSCCPAWVNYMEIFYPELINNLSSAKSPISMQGTMIKTYFAKNERINPEDVINVIVAPCTAKKQEIKRNEFCNASIYNKSSNKYMDNDFVITTREFAKWIKDEKIDFVNLENGTFDSPLGRGTGAGIIFGNTGGVAESALRTAYYYITGKDLQKNDIEFEKVRGMQGIKQTSIQIGEKNIKVAVANGMRNAKILIDKILNKEVEYDFVEVMNCIGGCIAGGGQPKSTILDIQKTKQKRIEGLYLEDKSLKKRVSYKNPDITKIYKEFLEYPNSEIAKELLHTKYEDKSYMLGE